EPGPPRPPDVAARTPPDVSGKAPGLGGSKMRDLNQGRPEGGAPKPQRKREIPRPAARIASLPPLKPRPPKDTKKAPEPVQKPIARPPIEALTKGNLTIQDILKQTTVPEVPIIPVEDEDEIETTKGAKGRPGGVAGRDKRHQQRNERAKARRDRGTEELPK